MLEEGIVFEEAVRVEVRALSGQGAGAACAGTGALARNTAALPTEYQAIVQMGGGDPLGDRLRPRAGRRRLPNGPRARSNIPWAASACST